MSASPPLGPTNDSGRQFPDESSRDWLRLDSGSSSKAALPKALPASVLPPAPPGYEIVGELARGGTSVVYKARHRGLNRLVALKVMNDSAVDPPERRVRFRAGAEELRRLQHPQIVQVHEVGEHEGRSFLALEYVDGPTLAQWLGRTPPAPHQAAALSRSLAQSMQYAHERGVLHRGLKPGNVLLQTAGENADPLLGLVPKIADFGLAPLIGPAVLGGAVGMPQYMAPEQVAGGGAAGGAPADIYSLGVILYEMLTGRPPFEGTSVGETVSLLQTQEPVPPRRLRPAIPRDLETICLKCLEKEPTRRYSSAGEMADDLASFLADRPIRARAAGPLRRALQWRRRNRAAAYPIVLTAVLLTVLATVGPVAAVWYSARARSARIGLQRSEVALAAAHEQRRQNTIQLADLHLAAATMTQDREPAKSLLFLAAAIEMSQRAGDEDREIVSRVRFRNGLGRTARPIAAFAALPPGSGPPLSWSIHPTGRWLLVATRVRAFLWDLQTQQPSPIPGGGIATCGAWNPAGNRIAVGTDDGARLHDFPGGALVGMLPLSGGASAIAFDATGTRIAVAGKALAVSTIATRIGLRKPRPLPARTLAVSFSAAGDQLVCAGGDARARVFSIDDSLAPLAEVPWQTPLEAGAAAPLVQPPLLVDRGRRIVALHPNRRQCGIWDAATGRELALLPPQPAPDTTLDILAPVDDKSVALAGSIGVALIDVTAPESALARTTLDWVPHRSRVLSVAVNPDSLTVVAGGLDPVIRARARNGSSGLYDLPTFRPIVATAFTGRDGRIATLQDDGLLRVWQPPPGLIDVPNDIELGQLARVISGLDLRDDATIVPLSQDAWLALWRDVGKRETR